MTVQKVLLQRKPQMRIESQPFHHKCFLSWAWGADPAPPDAELQDARNSSPAMPAL